MKASIIAILAAVPLSIACGSSAPSTELKNARDAYQRARQSDAAEYAPASVLGARQALQAAEQRHEDDPQSAKEKSAAYVAQRRAELAIIQGNIARERAEKQEADQQYVDLQERLRESNQQRLESLSGQLEEQTERAATLKDETERERQARLEAEARAERALESLRQVAQVKEEARGTVITLSGQVLFLTGKSELLPTAQDQLREVAKALTDSGDDRPIVVEGHTDSRGNEQMNQELSRERAESVRDYLINLGVPAERIRAVGRGESSPIATNDTPEGRANNRRVEIVIGKSAMPGMQQGTQPGGQGQGPAPQQQPSTPQSSPTQTPSEQAQ